MIRAIAAGAAVVVGGGTMVAAGGTVAAAHAVLSAPFAPAATGVSIEDGPEHTAILHAPPGTSVLAVSAGVVVPAGAQLTVQGDGDDAGLEVTYHGVAAISAAASVQRGDSVGTTPQAPAAITVRAVLDGHPLDTAALLRTALQNGTADAVSGWTRPVEGAVISQPFGCTPYAMEPLDRSCPGGHIHTGIDLAIARGTPVHAALDGIAHIVVSATGYGLHVILDHGDGLTTLYAHLDSVAVHEGDAVAAGDVIGTVGSTGNSTGPHLHFEVRRDGIAEDPALDLALP